MRQILQNLGSGETLLAEVPCPAVRPGHILIRSLVSLISLGTERMLVDFSKAGWIDKARQQPDKARQVLDKIKTDGVLTTIQAVQSKLDQPIALGYSNAGVIVEVGDGVDGFKPGDRVVSNGPHAEMVSVPFHLCTRVPDGVSNEAAAFTIVGAVALQGIRLLQPTLGETVAVVGLGLVGLLAVQLLQAHGCRVLGIDVDSDKCVLAQRLGAKTVDLARGEDPLAAGNRASQGRGVDAVLITASTPSHEPIQQAAAMCRKRGRIVLVGMTGLQLSRNDFYEKELTFQVSCSYGPGRYDERYELAGHDYPIGYVRWTEQRNFEAVLDMLKDQRIDVMPLISHRFEFEAALQAYERISKDKALGVLLEYPCPVSPKASSDLGSASVRLSPQPSRALSSVVVGIIGAGNFTKQVLLPNLRKTDAQLKTIVSHTGISGTHLGKKFGFEISTTDPDAIFSDPDINTVMITTRHDSHARYVALGIKAGKHVYVEKPLCLNTDELDDLLRLYWAQPDPSLTVGFNRRFAPHIIKMKTFLDTVKEPKSFIMTVNAGAIPATHWTQSQVEGGDRIVGEGCHYIDLLRFLVGQPITQVQTACAIMPDRMDHVGDTLSCILQFADGSLGTMHYFATGHRRFPKERLEVFCAGRILQLDNFRNLKGYGWPGFKRMHTARQDKGHAKLIASWINALGQGRPALIPFAEIVEVSRVTFEVVEQAMRLPDRQGA